MVQLFKVDKKAKAIENVPKNQVTQTVIAIQHNAAAVIGKSLFSGNLQFYKSGSISTGVGTVRNSNRKLGRT